jgi:adenosylhomocysteinase
MKDAAPVGDIFVTVTGCSSVIRREHFEAMKDGAIVSNSGHFDVEIALEDLKALTRSVANVRGGIQQHTLKDGRKINILGEGRLVNLACAEGHPPGVMDMSFANQALGCEYIKNNAKKLEKKVYPIPEEIDREIARLKLSAIGVSIDKLTPAQKKYLSSWDAGT